MIATAEIITGPIKGLHLELPPSTLEFYRRVAVETDKMGIFLMHELASDGNLYYINNNVLKN